jgi:hypothetical protein
MGERSVRAVAVCLVVSLAALAASACLIDQRQPDFGPGTLLVGGSMEQEIAQTVTAGFSGDLVEVRLPVFCTLDGQMTVQVQDTSGGDPGGTVLAQQMLSPGAQPAEPAFVRVVFDSPAYVASGTLFAIVLSSDDTCGVFAGPEEDSYPDGEGLHRSLPGLVWGNSFDRPFLTIVNILAPAE